MKILILDDDISFAKGIYNDLSNHFSGLTDKTEFTVVTNGFSSFQLSEKYDICFLDIDLKDYNGIVAQKNKYIINYIICFLCTSWENLLYFNQRRVEGNF